MSFGTNQITEDVLVFSNIWNEVLNGFSVPNFAKTIGIPETEARLLLSQIGTGKSKYINSLTTQQVHSSLLALQVCKEELGTEFQTRIGVEPDEAEEVITKLKNSRS